MKQGLRSGSLSLALLLGIAGAGCGDDDGMVEVDAGRDAGGGVDSGPPPEDTGPVDTGVDAPEPVEQAFVRVAHLSPNTGDVRLCIDLRVGGARVAGLGPLPTDGTIPFRGISPYIGLDIEEGVTYRFKAFVVESVADPVDCTMETSLSVDVDSADLEVNAFYTGAAIGFSPVEGTTLPSVCPNETLTAFDQPCPAALTARIAVFEDDSTLDAAASKIRVLHGIPNAPAVDVCYDANPEDETPGTAIAANVPFGMTSDYFESAADITTGVLTVHVAGTSCAPAAALAPPIVIPDTFAAIRANPAFATVRDNIPETFVLNRIYTVFAQGQAPAPITMSPNGLLFLPWQDHPPVVPEE